MYEDFHGMISDVCGSKLDYLVSLFVSGFEIFSNDFRKYFTNLWGNPLCPSHSSSYPEDLLLELLFPTGYESCIEVACCIHISPAGLSGFNTIQERLWHCHDNWMNLQSKYYKKHSLFQNGSFNPIGTIIVKLCQIEPFLSFFWVRIHNISETTYIFLYLFYIFSYLLGVLHDRVHHHNLRQSTRSIQEVRIRLTKDKSFTPDRGSSEWPFWGL